MSSKTEVSSASDGALNQNHLNNMKRPFGSRVNLIGFYVYGRAYSSTDGANTFPANSYGLKHEYGRSGTDVRRQFLLGGSIVGPKGLRLNRFIVGRSAVPFNITTGHDANDDRFIPTGRPSLRIPPAWAWSSRSAHSIRFRIPVWRSSRATVRAGPHFSRSISGLVVPSSSGARDVPGMRKPRPSRGVDPSRLWTAVLSPVSPATFRTEHRYNVTFSILACNLLNTVNPGPLTGNLSSPWFGTANAQRIRKPPHLETIAAFSFVFILKL